MKVIKRRKKRKRTARAAEGGGAEIEDMKDAGATIDDIDVGYREDGKWISATDAEGIPKNRKVKIWRIYMRYQVAT
ncbi:hypothetical protein ACHAXT_003380 [Thalassiosira profunda]